MDEFPFTDAEWETVREAALAVANAALADDTLLMCSHAAEVLAGLWELRERYGEHPVLLETAADYTEEPAARVTLYQRARDLAARHGLPTLSIRLSLAKLLLEEIDQQEAAKSELLACEGELMRSGDEAEREAWLELLGKCGEAQGDDAS